MQASPRRKASVLCAIALLSALTACSLPEPPPSSAEAKPVFATEAEALAAATKSYSVFNEMVGQIFQDGGVNPERIRSVAAERLAQSTIADFESVARQQIHSTGMNTFDSVTLQQVNESAPAGIEIVRVNLCLDVSTSDVVNAVGTSVAPLTRKLRTGVSVAFDWSPLEPGLLLVGSQDLLTTGEAC